MADVLTVASVTDLHVHLSDGTAWPRWGAVAWEMHHASHKTVLQRRHVAGTLISAYHALVDLSRDRRQQVVRCLREAEAQAIKEARGEEG